jgi:zinc finger protein
MAETEATNKDIFQVEGEQCPMCGKNEATFTEYETEDPYAGVIFIFSIKCNACGYKKSDLEFENPGDSAEYTYKVESKQDLDTRVIKSGECEITIPKLGVSIDSTFNGEFFVSNVEGVLNRFVKQLNFLKDGEDEKEVRKRIKNLLKKFDKVLHGDESVTIKMKDLSGNSAIISDKTVVKKIKA